jgi:TPR repeat protein
MLAICYETGQGINENKKKAFEYYLIAALEGDKQSVYEVGRCYYYGIGIKKNMVIGRIWLDKAQKLGINT